MKLEVLAIAAHPDDVELSCGGTMIKMAQMGYRTGILDLTRGEMGTRGTPETRAKEAAAAAKILGVSVRENLGLPDSRLEVREEYKRKIAVKIREFRPHTVILPYWEGRHPDHYNASKLGYEGCFLAGLKQMPLGGEPHRPFKIIYSTVYQDVRPSFAVDITAQFEKRKRAILAYKSQFMPPKTEKKSKVFLPLDELENEMALIAGYYGKLIGTRYAEPFLTREPVAVDDIVKLPVRSI
jgi:bacillithiol biosynthesis deacetylase BshB1